MGGGEIFLAAGEGAAKNDGLDRDADAESGEGVEVKGVEVEFELARLGGGF